MLWLGMTSKYNIRDSLLEHDGNHKKIPKKSKFPKVKDKNWALVLCEGIQLDDIMDMTGRVLVGRVRGKNYSSYRLRKWA